MTNLEFYLNLLKQIKLHHKLIIIMNFYLKYFTLIILALTGINLFSQSKKCNKLQLLEVIDTGLYKVLDKVIDFEKGCIYYNSDLLFEIAIQSQNDSIFQITISSFGDKKYDLTRDFGCFTFRHHLFFVTNSRSKSDTEILFKNTKNEHIIKLTKAKKGRLLILDDSYTIWSFLYINGVFIFDSKGSSCPDTLNKTL